MRTKIETFDNILKIVTHMSYSFEVPFYKNDLWNNASKVVDIGCGNAEYTSLLSASYPDKSFIGVEQNPKIAALAGKRHSSDKLKIVNKDYLALPKDFVFDFLVARRFILPIIHKRQEFFNWLMKHTSPTTGILLIDTNIENFIISASSELPRFSAYYQSMVEKEKLGQYSNINGQIIEEMLSLGFQLKLNQASIISTMIPGIKEKLYAYMRLSVELYHGIPIPTDIDNELFEWLINPNSYGQFEIFGMMFEGSKLK